MQSVVTTILVFFAATLSVEEIREYWDVYGTYPPEKIMPYFENGTQEYLGQVFYYQLFKPVNEKGPYPMIVWMHGYGEEEFDDINAGQLRHLGYFFKNSNPEEHDFYLLAMQVPRPPGVWLGGSGPEPGEALIELIDKLTEKYAIDKNRIQLVGVSGGSMVMDMAMRHPKIFASIVPISSGKCDYSRFPSILEVPVWAFHRKDDKPPVSDVQDMVDEINRLGGTAHLTVFPGYNHDAWRPAFRSCDLVNWLLSQKRGDWFPKPPGYLPWRWWQLVGQIGLPAIVGFASIATFVRSNMRRGWFRRHWLSVLLAASILSLAVSSSSIAVTDITKIVDVRIWSAAGWRVALIATTLWMLLMLYLLRRLRDNVHPAEPAVRANNSNV